MALNDPVLQSGVGVVVAYKPEGTWGVAPGQSGATALRRVQSGLDYNADGFQSNEVRPDQQIADFRLGVHRVQGPLSGELSTQSYDDFLAATVRNTWVSGVAAAGLSLTIVKSAGTIARDSGSFLTDLFKVGDVIRLSSGLNTAKNILIAAISSDGTTITSPTPLLDETHTADVTVAGHKAINGLLRPSFAIEHQYPDVVPVSSELFLGCFNSQTRFSLPPTGMSTVEFTFMGQDAALYDDQSSPIAPYFTNPTAPPTTHTLASINGALMFDGKLAATVTQMDLTVDHGLAGDPVQGRKTLPALFFASAKVQGSITLLFENNNFAKKFLNEQEFVLTSLLEGPAATAGQAPDFLTLSMPRIKCTGKNRTIPPNGGIPVTYQFQALKQQGVAGYDNTTLAIQKSN